MVYDDIYQPLRIDALNRETGQFMTSVIMPMSVVDAEEFTRDFHPQNAPVPEPDTTITPAEHEAITAIV